MLGGNTSGEAVILRPIGLQCVGVWISTGLLCMRMYMCIYVHIQSTISILNYDLRKTQLAPGLPERN